MSVSHWIKRAAASRGHHRAFRRTFHSTATRRAETTEPLLGPARSHFSKYSSQYINIGWSFLAFGLGIQVVKADREKKAAEEEVEIARAQLEEASTKAGSGFGAEERTALQDATWARTVVNSMALAGDAEEARAQALVVAIRARVDDVGRRRAKERVMGGGVEGGGGGDNDVTAAETPSAGDGLQPPSKRVSMV